jgi:hypothetical protein
MKIPLFVSVVAFSSLLKAEESPSLAFRNLQIQAPSLSLIEIARQGMLPIFDERERRDSGLRQSSIRPPTRVSRMPIILPRAELDDAMVIKEPEASIDYRLLVKTPDVISAK